MTKSELILKITSKNSYLYQKDVYKIIDTLFNCVTKAFKDGDAGWFLYNSFAQLMSLNATMIRARIILWLRKMGIHPAILLTLGSLGFIFTVLSLSYLT